MKNIGALGKMKRFGEPFRSSNSSPIKSNGVEEEAAACRSFESYLVEMIAEEGKVRDLMDVEELLYCWNSLKSPVFIELVSTFYGQLCRDLFSDREDRFKAVDAFINILRDDSGHLKVADFGLSKLLNMTKSIREDRPLVCEDNGCRYVAPEVFRNEEYDTKVDVFSFGLILQEMIEGCMPFNTKPDSGVPKLYAAKERPPFRAPPRHYPYGLKELIVQCWSESPADRPTCRDIIERLTYIQNHITQKQRWKVRALRCFQNIEAIWKDRSTNSRSRSTRSTSSNF